MAKQSYHVVDNNDKKIGILFLDASPTAADNAIGNLFQSTAHTPWDDTTTHVEIEKTVKNFWASDGATYAIAGAFVGGVLLTYAWWYSLDAGAWIVGGTLLTAVGLHALKIWAHRPARPEPEQTETTHKIEIVTTEDYGHARHTLIDQIEDDTISIDELRRVARAWTDGTSFARRPMVIGARVSHDKFRKIKAEFERLNLCHTDAGNRNHLTLRGKAVLRQLAAD